MTTAEWTDTATTVTARTAALILEDVLRGKTPIRIARERAVDESVVLRLRAAYGHPHAAKLRHGVAALVDLGDALVDVFGHQNTPAESSTPTVTPPAPPAPAPAETTDGTRLLEVRVADVHVDPDNPRENLTNIDDLAQSIDASGLLQPIVVRRHKGQLVVVAGHRRLAAVKHLDWQRVQVIVRGDMRPDDVLAAMLIENGQRTDLDPVEEARALRRLKTQMGEVSDGTLAARVGRTQVHVSSRLAILALPIEEQELLRAGQMNLGDAVRRGRIASGRVRKANSTGHPHLGMAHDLARHARARCIRLAHKSKGRNSVGGVACGECWESVIRADERDHLQRHTAEHGRCAVCGTEQATSEGARA